MLSKKTRKIITSVMLSLTISLSFLGTSIKVKAFDTKKAVYKIENAKTYEYTDSYDISVYKNTDYAKTTIYVGSISSTPHQLDKTPFIATIDGKPIEIFKSTKISLEEKEKELLEKEVDDSYSAPKNKVFGIWEQELDGNYILHLYIINTTSGFNKTLKISKEFISGDLDYGLYNKDTEEFNSKLKEILNSSYDTSDLLNIYKYDINYNENTHAEWSKIPYGNKTIIDKTKEITKNCNNDMEKVQAIYRFVVKHMDYDLNSSYKNKGALSALQTGKGVCEDYACLFIAMCREAKIPARYVHGLNYKDKFGSHGWAEFYLPYYGWIRVEPTVPDFKKDKDSDEDINYYMMSQFVGNHKLKNSYPIRTIVGYNNNENRYLYPFEKDTNMRSNYKDSTVTIKGNPTESVVLYNQPFSNYQERINSVNELLEKARTTKKENDIKAAKELAETLIDSDERTNILQELERIENGYTLKDEISMLTVKLLHSNTIDSEQLKKLNELWDKASEEIKKEFEISFISVQKRYEIETLIKETENNLTEENIDKLAKLRDDVCLNTTYNIDKEYLDIYMAKYDELLNKYFAITNQNMLLEDIKLTLNTMEACKNSSLPLECLEKDLTEVSSKIEKVTDTAKKNEFLERLKPIEEFINKQKINIQKVTALVEKAEQTKKIEDYTNALNEVEKLQFFNLREELKDRLNKVKDIIDNKTNEEPKKQDALENAIKLVAQAEKDNKEDIYNTALNVVNTLDNGQNKTDLLARLTKVKAQIDSNKANADEKAKKQKAIEDATKLVAQAEKDNKEDSYNTALNVVNTLDNGQNKTDLLARLTKVKTIIDNNKANADEKAKKQKAIENATKLVENAENDNKEISYNKAFNVVNALEDIQSKTDLLARLTKVKTNIDSNKANADEKAKKQKAIEDATKLVEKAEKDISEDSYNKAFNVVNALDNGQSKTDLLARLTKVEKNINENKNSKAIELVKYAEKNPSISSYTIAKDSVDLLKNSALQQQLLNRLSKVEKIIKQLDKNTEKQQLLDYVNDLVREAETKATEESYNKALEQAKKIEDIETRKVYINRLKEVKKDIDRNIKIEINSLRNKLKEVGFQFDLGIAEINELKTKVNDIKDKDERNKMIKKINKLEVKYNKIKNNKDVRQKVDKIKAYDKWNKVFANIDTDKTFTVGFNREINDKFINKDNIYVLDADKLEKVDAKIEINNKKLKISSENLEKGTNYIIIISDRLKSKGNQKLKNPIKIYVYTDYEN